MFNFLAHWFFSYYQSISLNDVQWNRIYHQYSARTWSNIKKKFLEKNPGPHFCSYCQIGPLKKMRRDNEKHALMLTLDHIVPLSKGGSLHELENLTPACSLCNGSKNDMSLKAFRRFMQKNKAFKKAIRSRNKQVKKEMMAV